MNTHEEICKTINDIQYQIKAINKICFNIMDIIGSKVCDKDGLIFTQYFDEFNKVYTSNDTMYENLIFELKNDHFSIKYRMNFKNSYENAESVFKDIKDHKLDITFAEDTTDVNRILTNYKYVTTTLHQIFKKLYNK